MEFDWNIGIVALGFWIICLVAIYYLPYQFGSRGYPDAIGWFWTIVISAALAPISYAICHKIGGGD